MHRPYLLCLCLTGDNYYQPLSVHSLCWILVSLSHQNEGYANLSIAANGNLLVDNYKESIAVYLILASDHKMKVVVKSHDRNTLGRVQRTFESANSITTEDVRSLIRTAVERHEDKCRMLVSVA